MFLLAWSVGSEPENKFGGEKNELEGFQENFVGRRGNICGDTGKGEVC